MNRVFQPVRASLRDPNTMTNRILRFLTHVRATSRDVAVALTCPNAAVILDHLLTNGFVRRTRVPKRARGRRAPDYAYELTERGSYRVSILRRNPERWAV